MNQALTEEFKAFFEQLLEQSKNSEQLIFEDNVFNLGKVSAGDDGDRAMDEREKALRVRLQARQNFYSKKVQKSLDKIAKGSFGECEECGGEISLERLKARPTASMCIHCKEEQEMAEGQVPYQKRSHTFGKEIFNAASQNAS